MKSDAGDFKYRRNKWYKHDGELEMCESGFHCSKEPYDAFSHVQGEILAQVEVRGDHLEQEDKEVWEEIRIVKTWKWQKKDSVALAIYAAEQVIDIYEKEYPDDKRPKEAIKAAKRWLKNPTKKNRDAAWDVWDAGTVGGAARAAAKAILMDKIHTWFTRRIPKLDKYGRS